MNPEVTSDTRLRGRWLDATRVLWVVIATLTVSLFVAGIPAAFEALRTPCEDCGTPQLTQEYARQLQALGLSMNFYAAYLLAFQLVFAITWFTVAGAIFWRKSGEWLASLVALALLTFGAAFPDPLDGLEQQQPVWSLPINLIRATAVISFVLMFYLFPDGRFVPRWTRILSLVWAPWAAAGFLGSDVLSGPSVYLYYGVLGAGVFAQIYRYRHVSNPIQQQQTKWVVFGFSTAILVFLGLNFVGQLAPPSLRQSVLPLLFWLPAYYLFMLLIPLSFGLAILRYRLWDIDLLINRTLVYGTLTAALLLVYFGSVVLLQQLFRALTGQQSELAIVVSTLAIVALFNPLRRRIQTGIDRRFYRRKYDAAQTLAVFSATVRDEVDLDKLTGALLAVVEETMQPAHVSLWLKPSNVERQRSGATRGI
jgi:hypothetical protein